MLSQQPLTRPFTPDRNAQAVHIQGDLILYRAGCGPSGRYTPSVVEWEVSREYTREEASPSATSTFLQACYRVFTRPNVTQTHQGLCAPTFMRELLFFFTTNTIRHTMTSTYIDVAARHRTTWCRTSSSVCTGECRESCISQLLAVTSWMLFPLFSCEQRYS